jgi:hypothetical protein
MMWRNRFFQSKDLPSARHRGIVDEMPVYFGMPSNYTIDDVGAKSVVGTSGSEKI